MVGSSERGRIPLSEAWKRIEMSAQIAKARYAQPRRRADREPRRIRPHHPRGRQRQRAVAQPNRDVLDASTQDAPARRGHCRSRERMERIGDPLLIPQNPGAMSLSRPAQVKPISPLPSRAVVSARESAGGSSPLLISSTSWRRRRAPAGRAASPITSRASTSSFSMNSAICPSRKPAHNCCSISSAGSTSAHRSSSPPTSPSANGQASSAIPR